LLFLSCCLTPLIAQDADGDGLSDAQEAALGTPADRAEIMTTVIEDGPEPEARRALPTYVAGQDILDVAFGHVAEDRQLWRVTFNGEPDLAQTVLHFYVDSDADPKTGRQGAGAAQGTDYMLSIPAGSARVSAFAPDGTAGKPVPLRFQVAGQAVWICADVSLRQGAGGLDHNLYLLCHTANSPSPPMSDTTAEVNVTGIAVRPGAKIVRLTDRTESWNVSASFELDVVRAVLANPANVFLDPAQLTLDGYSMDLFTQRRYPHLKVDRQGAKASAHPAKAGRYYVGFLMYDDTNDEKIAIHVNDQLAGLAVSNRSNNRHWVYWLSEARDLTPADNITLEAVGAGGKHPIAGMIFMPQPPEVRDVTYTVDNLKWLAPVGTTGEVWLSWTTSWPSSTRFEYQTAGGEMQVVTEDVNRLVHKARLKGLSADAKLRGRGVGTKPDGTTYAGDWADFTAAGAPRPQTVAGLHSVPLRIRNPLDVNAVNWPVTGGVPFPKGTLGSALDLRLTQDGRELPIQVAETGAWPDGSLKWVLLTLLADVPAGQTADYRLEYGRDVKRAAVTVASPAAGPTPRLAYALAPGGEVAATAGASRVEEAGPLRRVTHHAAKLPDSSPVRLEWREEAYAGSPLKRLHLTVTVAGEAEFCDLDSLRADFALLGAGWSADRVEGQPVTLPSAGDPLAQRFDREYATGVNAASGTAGRLTGTVRSDQGLVAVRDGWANYPLGFDQAGGRWGASAATLRSRPL